MHCIYSFSGPRGQTGYVKTVRSKTMFIVELNSINLTPGSAEKSKRIAFQKRGRGRDKHTDENFLDESSGIQVPLGLWNLPAEMVIKERSQGFNNLDSKRWVKLGPWLGIKVVERTHLTCISHLHLEHLIFLHLLTSGIITFQQFSITTFLILLLKK